MNTVYQFAIFLLCVALCTCTQFKWKSEVDGSWNDPEMWESTPEGGQYPQSDDIAIFDSSLSNPIAVSLTNDTDVAELVIKTNNKQPVEFKGFFNTLTASKIDVLSSAVVFTEVNIQVYTDFSIHCELTNCKDFNLLSFSNSTVAITETANVASWSGSFSVEARHNTHIVVGGTLTLDGDDDQEGDAEVNLLDSSTLSVSGNLNAGKNVVISAVNVASTGSLSVDGSITTYFLSLEEGSSVSIRYPVNPAADYFPINMVRQLTRGKGVTLHALFNPDVLPNDSTSFNVVNYELSDGEPFVVSSNLPYPGLNYSEVNATGHLSINYALELRADNVSFTGGYSFFVDNPLNVSVYIKNNGGAFVPLPANLTRVEFSVDANATDYLYVDREYYRTPDTINNATNIYSSVVKFNLTSEFAGRTFGVHARIADCEGSKCSVDFTVTHQFRSSVIVYIVIAVIIVCAIVVAVIIGLVVVKRNKALAASGTDNYAKMH